MPEDIKRYAQHRPKKVTSTVDIDPNAAPLTAEEEERQSVLAEIISRHKDGTREFVTAVREMIDRKLFRPYKTIEGYLNHRHEISKSWWYALVKQVDISDAVGSAKLLPVRTTAAIAQIRDLSGESAAIVHDMAKAVAGTKNGVQQEPRIEDYDALRKVLVRYNETGAITFDGRDFGSLAEVFTYCATEEVSERIKTNHAHIHEERQTRKEREKNGSAKLTDEVPKRHRGGNSLTLHCSGKGHGNVGIAKIHPGGAWLLTCDCLYKLLTTGELVNWIEEPVKPKPTAKVKK